MCGPGVRHAWMASPPAPRSGGAAPHRSRKQLGCRPAVYSALLRRRCGGVRRSGWFVAGMATAVGVVAAGEVARRRMRGPADELPPAVGYEQAMGPAPVVDEPIAEPAEPEAEASRRTSPSRRCARRRRPTAAPTSCARRSPRAGGGCTRRPRLGPRAWPAWWPERGRRRRRGSDRGALRWRRPRDWCSRIRRCTTCPPPRSGTPTRSGSAGRSPQSRSRPRCSS